MTTIGFFALAVFGLGALTVITDTDIISVPDIGQAPGIVGMIIAIVVFAGVLWLAVRSSHPRFRSVWTIAILTALVHVLAVGATVTFSGDFIASLAVMSGLVTGGASLVVLVAAAIAAWAGVALRRTRASRPRWPWEHE